MWRPLSLVRRRRAEELSAVRRRLDLLSARRLQGVWSDDDEVEYDLMVLREHRLLERLASPRLDHVLGARPSSVSWRVRRSPG